jgi:hypothetical protein
MATTGTTSSAAGYRSMGILNSPVFAKSLTTRLYCGTVMGNIASQDIVPAEIKKCGDTVVFRHEPKPEIFSYVKNQDLEVSELNTDAVIMHVNRMKYYNVKVDDVDLERICDLRTYIDAFIKNAGMELEQAIDKEGLAHIPMNANCYNKGPNAGKISRAYNLGQTGAPVQLTANSIMQTLSYVTGALSEQCGDMTDSFIVLPFQARTLFFNNPLLTSAFVSGMDKSIVFGGKIPSSLFGINIMFSKHLLQHQEPGGVTAYSIPFGHKRGTAFVTQATKAEYIDKDTRAFAKYYRGRNFYDFKVIDDRYVGNLYATVTI